MRVSERECDIVCMRERDSKRKREREREREKERAHSKASWQHGNISTCKDTISKIKELKKTEDLGIYGTYEGGGGDM